MEEKKYIIAVTSCVAGVAHTYMSAKALELACEELGYECKVEKQGGAGLQDKLTKADIARADGLIIACEQPLREKERFANFEPKVELKDTSTLIKDAKKIAQDLIENSKSSNFKSQKPLAKNTTTTTSLALPLWKRAWLSFKGDFRKCFFGGIMYVVPIIVVGGMIMGILSAIAQINESYFANDKTYNTWFEMTSQIMQLYPILLAMFISFLYADKPGIAPGFAAGILINLHFENVSFIGGMIAGITAGYVTRLIVHYIRPNLTWQGLVVFLIYPVLGAVISGALVYWVVGWPAYGITLAIEKIITSSGEIVLPIAGFLVAGMAMVDCGGIFSKSSFAATMVVAGDGSNSANTALWVAYGSGIFAVSFALLLASLLQKKYYSNEALAGSSSAWIPAALGGISEGSLPALFTDMPSVSSSYFIGAGLAGMSSILFGLQQHELIMHTGLVVMPWFLETSAGSDMLATGLFFVAELIGFISALICLLFFKQLRFGKASRANKLHNGIIDPVWLSNNRRYSLNMKGFINLRK